MDVGLTFRTMGWIQAKLLGPITKWAELGQDLACYFVAQTTKPSTRGPIRQIPGQPNILNHTHSISQSKVTKWMLNFKFKRAKDTYLCPHKYALFLHPPNCYTLGFVPRSLHAQQGKLRKRKEDKMVHFSNHINVTSQTLLEVMKATSCNITADTATEAATRCHSICSTSPEKQDKDSVQFNGIKNTTSTKAMKSWVLT